MLQCFEKKTIKDVNSSYITIIQLVTIQKTFNFLFKIALVLELCKERL